MKQPPRQRPLRDERDEQIKKDAQVYAMEWVIAITQILTIMCAVKGNPAWRGTLSLLFFGVAFTLFYHFKEYEEKPFEQVGVVFLAIGVALLVWFGVTG